MHEVELTQGTVRYSDRGTGDVVVLLHGLIVDGRLWDGVVAELEREFRCVVPDLPLGAHQLPLAAHADRSPAGVARLVADFLAALDLTEVTLVGCDTGGVIAQLVATRYPERVGRLVLTPCDLYDNFLPALFKPLQLLARVPGGLKGLALPLQWRPLRRTPPAFGWLMKHPIDPAVEQDWIRRFLADAGVRRDAGEFLKAIDPQTTVRAADELAAFGKPVLFAWAPEDRVFPIAQAEKLAATIPGARVERVEDAYSFVPVDQPRRTAELIGAFAGRAH
jgi:pimeloyl-ACP methyl ester carboxylesterase